MDVTSSEYGFIAEILRDDGIPYLKTHAITNIAWNPEMLCLEELIKFADRAMCGAKDQGRNQVVAFAGLYTAYISGSFGQLASRGSGGAQAVAQET